VQDLHPPVGIEVDHAVEDGSYVLGDAPGLGVRVDEEAIAALGLRPNLPRPDGPGVRPERAGQRLLTTTASAATYSEPMIARPLQMEDPQVSA
jgi:hypothetical protein